MRPKNFHGAMVDQLALRIIADGHGAEAQLPIEGALAAELGVSRTVLREAIKTLVAKGRWSRRAWSG